MSPMTRTLDCHYVTVPHLLQNFHNSTFWKASITHHSYLSAPPLFHFRMSSLDITSVLGSYYFHQTHTANAPKSPIDPLCSVFNLYDNDNPNEETDVTEFDSSHIKISDVHPPELDQYLPCLNNFVTVPTPTPFWVPTQKVLHPWLKANVTPEPEHVPITAQYNSPIADKGTHGSTYTSHISVLLTEAPSTILKVGTEVEGGIEGRYSMSMRSRSSSCVNWMGFHMESR